MGKNAISGKCTIGGRLRALRIYYADTERFDAERALVRGRSPSADSAAAWSLLLYVLRRDFGLDALPAVAEDGRGKPFFPAAGGIHFSLSHTRGRVLCAVSGSEVGADIQLISEKDAPFAARLMSEREREDFTLHELWCLREAVYKLTGKGELRSMPFRREGGVIVPPFEGVACRLYAAIPGFAAAAASRKSELLPESAEQIPTQSLQKGV